MTKQLTVHNAELHTATVGVKTLTISGKQVTLAVFRQLAVQNPIDYTTGELRGELWGHVNYLKKLYLEGASYNVVWQYGSELRRYEVTKPRMEWLAEDRSTWDGDDWRSHHRNLCLEQSWLAVLALPQLFIAV